MIHSILEAFAVKEIHSKQLWLHMFTIFLFPGRYISVAWLVPTSKTQHTLSRKSSSTLSCFYRVCDKVDPLRLEFIRPSDSLSVSWLFCFVLSLVLHFCSAVFCFVVSSKIPPGCTFSLLRCYLYERKVREVPEAKT